MVDDHNSHAKFMVGVQQIHGKKLPHHGWLIFYGKLVGKWEEEKQETLITVKPATRSWEQFFDNPWLACRRWLENSSPKHVPHINGEKSHGRIVHPGKLTRNPNMEDDFNFQLGEF